MKRFVKLFVDLDSTTSLNEKVDALKNYLTSSSPSDSMWSVLLLTGRISKKTITSRGIKDLFLIATKYPEWLLDASASNVGDSAETLSLLAQTLGLCRTSGVEAVSHDTSLTTWMEERLPALGRLKDQAEQAALLLSWWRDLDQQEVFILNKLMTGAFRVGVSEKLVVRALAAVFELETDQVAHRLTGSREAGADRFAKLISKEKTSPSFSQPYPFCLANAWGERNEIDFNPLQWCVEWKFDGIRAQIIRREGQTWIWSRGEEDITSGFPDLVEVFEFLPEGTVLDGEIVVVTSTNADALVAPFQELQKRLGRKKVSPAVLKSHPAGFVAYDCIEFGSRDVRSEPLSSRKEFLKKVLEGHFHSRLRFSEVLNIQDLTDLARKREEARNEAAEGLMLKAWSSPYVVGRKTGNWWKHKVDPLTLDAVLIYAQAGSGRRANLYTDYTFALWDQEKNLVPFAKAYSGLDQKEIDELDHWIRRHTKEKFGPVRSVEPHFVFEIGFEGIGKSSRHKSGIAVRFPRILRWRRDKPPTEADTLATANLLMQGLSTPAEVRT